MFSASKHFTPQGEFTAVHLSSSIWLSTITHKDRFVALTRKITLPPRRDPSYPESLRSLHSAILGLCALIESLPYSVEPWIPSLTEGMLLMAMTVDSQYLMAFPPSKFWHLTPLTRPPFLRRFGNARPSLRRYALPLTVLRL